MDPRYLDCTAEDIILDVWAHRHVDNPKLRDELVNPDFEGDLAAMEEEFGIPHEDMPPEEDPGDFEPVVSETYQARR